MDDRMKALRALAALSLCAGLAACSLPTAPDRGRATPSPEGFSVEVALRGVPDTASRALIADGNVASVQILVSDSAGASLGSGLLSKGGSYWSGTIPVSATGLATFSAYARSAAGAILYVGKATQSLSGSGDIVPVAVGPAALRGGSIQGQPLSLAPTLKAIAGSSPSYPDTVFYRDGIGTAARFQKAGSLTCDGTNLYIADFQNQVIRKMVIATCEVSTLAGLAATSGSADGIGADARFYGPTAITTDGTYLYVVDWGNDRLRKIVIATREVSTIPASVSGAYGITTDGTYVYAVVYGSSCIRKIEIATGAATSIAIAAVAKPYGIATDGTYLYVSNADAYHPDIYKVLLSTGEATLVAAGASTLITPYGLCCDGPNLYLCDTESVFRIVIATGAITKLTTVTFVERPYGIATDGANLYTADYGSSQPWCNLIRKIQ
jgi:hypothetical protein